LEERRRLLVLIAATTGAILIPLNTGMLSVALTPITGAFHVPVATGTWLILLYLLLMTSLQPSAGKLGDRYGHRRIFLVGLLTFALASAGAALAPTFGWLILLRGLQGVAGATLAPNATALIRLAYPVERQGQAMGLYVGAFSLGLTLGPVFGGLLISTLGWQATFWINLPIALFAAWLGQRTLPTGTGSDTVAFDWWGSSIFAVLIGGAVVAVNLWKEGRLPVPFWTVLPVLAVLGLALYWVEERAQDPLLRIGLFLLPGFGASNAAIYCVHTAMYAVMIAVPIYLEQARGLSATTAGLYMAVFAVLQVAVAPVAGRLSDRLDRRQLVGVAGVFFLLGAAVLWRLNIATALLWVPLGLALVGTGVGLTTAPVQAALLSACPPALVGVGSGVWYSSRYLGNISGALLTSLLLPANPGQSAHGLYTVLGVAAVLLTASSRFLKT
jgi:EmrB/QacA subfamily drug resistance transporter